MSNVSEKASIDLASLPLNEVAEAIRVRLESQGVTASVVLLRRLDSDWREWRQHCDLRAIQIIPITLNKVRRFLVEKLATAKRPKKKPDLAAYLRSFSHFQSASEPLNRWTDEESSDLLESLNLLHLKLPEPLPPITEPQRPRRVRTRRAQSLEPEADGRTSFEKSNEAVIETEAGESPPEFERSEESSRSNRSVRSAPKPKFELGIKSPNDGEPGQGEATGAEVSNPARAESDDRYEPLWPNDALRRSYILAGWRTLPEIQDEAARKAEVLFRRRASNLTHLLQYATREVFHGQASLGGDLIRGCILGCGGYAEVAATMKVSVDTLKLAFDPDEIPSKSLTLDMVGYLLKQIKRTP